MATGNDCSLSEIHHAVTRPCQHQLSNKSYLFRVFLGTHGS